MTAVVLTPRRPDRTTGVVTNLDDRWALPSSSIGRFSVGMAAMLVLSLALHATLVAIAYLNDGTHVAPSSQEAIAVEIVQDVPKPPPIALKPALPEPSQEEAKAEAAPVPKSEPPKTEPPKSEPLKSELQKPEAPKSDPPKAEPAKSAAAPQPVKQVEAPKPVPPKEEANEKTLKSLESQFEALKTERAALEAERVAQDQHVVEDQHLPAAVAAPQPGAPMGMGPLPDSFQAIALPATSDGVGDAVSYQQIVFSQLAKANEIGKTQGLPGSSGVHFEIDETGKLISVEVVAPSGVPSLDAMAVTIVRKAAPFPPPPQGAQRSFDANVNFVAEGAP